MPFSIRNIIIFVGLAAVFSSVYILFIKSPEDANLVSNSIDTIANTVATMPSGEQNVLAQNFLSLLLNIKNIKLDDSIFSEKAFQSLHDSSIVLIPDASSGRPNPFAQFGSDTVATPPSTDTSTTPAAGVQ